MKKYAVSILFICLNTLFVLGQPSKQKRVKGYYILQDSGKVSSNDCVFCNPETMPDRIVLDSTYRMVARKINNPFGYTYYEWRGNNYGKSYEIIFLHKYNFLHTTYFENGSSSSPPEKNRFMSSFIEYSLLPYNKKQAYNGEHKAISIRIQLSKNTADSILKLYHIPKEMIQEKTKLWDMLDFNENGNIKSFGILITGLKEKESKDRENTSSQFRDFTPPARYKIGIWQYCNDNGKNIFKENIKEIRKEPNKR